MNQTTEQETREDARPDVACSATSGRVEWSAEIDQPDADGETGAMLLDAQGRVLAALCIPAYIDAAKLVGEICALPALLARVEAAEADAAGWRDIARTNEAAYNDALAALRARSGAA